MSWNKVVLKKPPTIFFPLSMHCTMPISPLLLKNLTNLWLLVNHGCLKAFLFPVNKKIPFLTSVLNPPLQSILLLTKIIEIFITLSFARLRKCTLKNNSQIIRKIFVKHGKFYFLPFIKAIKNQMTYHTF